MLLFYLLLIEYEIALKDFCILICWTTAGSTDMCFSGWNHYWKNAFLRDSPWAFRVYHHFESSLCFFTVDVIIWQATYHSHFNYCLKWWIVPSNKEANINHYSLKQLSLGIWSCFFKGIFKNYQIIGLYFADNYNLFLDENQLISAHYLHSIHL